MKIVRGLSVRWAAVGPHKDSECHKSQNARDSGFEF